MPPLLFFKKIHAEICHYQLAHNDDDDEDKSETSTTKYLLSIYAYGSSASWWIVERVQARNFACRNFTKNLALPNH